MLISSLHLRWERWLIPALPFFAILTAEGARQLVEFVQKRLRFPAWAAAAAITGLVLLPMLLTDVRERAGTGGNRHAHAGEGVDPAAGPAGQQAAAGGRTRHSCRARLTNIM